MPRLRTFVVAFAAVLLLGALVSGCGSDKSGSPETDKSQDLVPLTGDGFSMKLPSETTKTVRTVPTAAGKVKVVLYSTGDDPDGTYLVALTAYPAGTVVDLDKAVAGAAKNVDGVVRANDPAKYRGHDARDARFTATSSGTEITVFVRVVDLGGKLFQLQYAKQGADVKTPPAEFDLVASSVRFSG